MITKVEQALIERLRLGLGKMVYSVGSYSGEIDDSQLDVRRLPACLVSYAGSDFDARSVNARGKRYQATDTFVVLVMARSMRSAVAGRVGGVTQQEVGVNLLLSAVKYLLINQTLGGLVSPIQPKRIRTIWNNAEVKKEKISAFAIEFEMSYTENGFLEDGRFPEGISELEQLFKQYQGKLDPPYDELHGLNDRIFDPTNNATTAVTVVTEEK
ncbi:DUF1834 family protein [Glaesserella parasuis]|uniref:DUF1834 family protein n=1 Tax=Glaesserella parasuis TaxID=738 RepID=UPI00049EDA3B|nr:DUF1834 family protein [Glaesserella parasuis]KDD82411.1 hypothetical protein HPS42_00160 [Glaesserella parasuis ST4-2]MCT8542743.1 DUF1834 family protein [Glaesserella parasuis]MCT8544877.1 DUF1834 family protein [Glaesserella parasuis]MCT8685160.1 DUF1834 family protein [Glaesserella parasuis]MCT8751648.1 DUF1834 family protein [Glaesserella parasuis]